VQFRADPVVLTRAQARASGIKLADLRGPRFTRLFHDTYVPSSELTTLWLQAATVMKRLPAAHHVSHHTAVRLWGGVAPDDAGVHVSMLTREDRCRRSGVAAHLAGEGAAITTCRGLSLSTPAQAFLDLASVGTSLVDLVIAGDSLVKATRLEPDALIEAADAWPGRHAKRARRAARLVREGVDSPMETRLRLLIVLAGLPEPEVNFILRAPDGSWRRRFDLCYPGYRLIIEYDGRKHAFDQEQWSGDLTRREELDELEWRIIVVESSGIYADPLRTALQSRGVRVPKTFKQEWTRHFAMRV
jgi:very-short-patch-repair endonuclease